MSWATSLWYCSSTNTQKEQIQSNANPITFKKKWKINSFLILSSQNSGRDPKLHWMVPRCLAQTTIKSTLSSKCPQERLSQKQYFLYNWTELRPFLPSRVLKFFTSSFNTLFLFPRSSCPWESLYLKNYLLPTGRVDPSAWLEPCRTPKGLSRLCIGLLKAGWRTIRS